MTWTPETKAYAGKKWLQGHSASEIARDLRESFGLVKTRNAVIGVLHRNGYGSEGRAIPRKPDTYRPAKPIKAPKVARSHVKPPKPGPQTPLKLAQPPVAPKLNDIESPFARPWMERGPDQCRFPLGERHAILSCCNPVERGGYCEGHAAVCFVGVPLNSQGYRFSRSVVDAQAAWFTRGERVDSYQAAKPRKSSRPTTIWDEARAA